MQDILDELAAWAAGLPPEWVLLFALPFAVALAGLLAHRKTPAPRRQSDHVRRSGVLDGRQWRP